MNPNESMYELGPQLVREMRGNFDAGDLDDDSATDRLRWGGDEFGDEELWQALLGALDEASTDDEHWILGDGFIPESIRPRPGLDGRLELLEQTDERMKRIILLVERDSYGDEGPWRLPNSKP
jgi:hypothetical protein